MAKNMTLRLSDEQAADLEMISRADGKPITETVRDAIDLQIEQRRNDKDFQSRLKRLMEEHKEVLERLAQ